MKRVAAKCKASRAINDPVEMGTSRADLGDASRKTPLMTRVLQQTRLKK
jgi:hypothetical protein